MNHHTKPSKPFLKASFARSGAFFTLFSLSALPFLAKPVWAAPVGMAAHVAGTVQLERDGKKSGLKLLQRVEDGDVVTCAANAQAVLVLFNSGARFQIGAGKSAKISAANITGATRLTDISGPSSEVVKLLGSARVGASMSRATGSFQRLSPQFSGWLPAVNPRFEWLPISGAASYTFTLFDPHDNVVWSDRTTQASAAYPAGAPILLEKRSYLWRLSGFGASGKPVPETRTGLVAFLSVEDAAKLTVLVADLQKQAAASPDTTPLLLLAEAYNAFGVVGKTFEILEDKALSGENGVAEAKSDILATLSPFTRSFAPKPDDANPN